MLIDRVATHWEDLGLAELGMEQYKIDNAKDDNNIKSCRKLLQKFMKNGAPKCKKTTWCYLLEALRRANLGTYAETLEHALPLCNL